MSAYRELAAARPAPAWVSWSGALLVLLALLIGAAGALLTSAGLGAKGQATLAAPLLPTLAPDTLLSPDGRAVLKEVGKQAVEQPLHFMMAAAPVLLSRGLAGVPWYGWAATPLLAWREWSQWPSKRWWDPPLDWAFLTLGVVTATWRCRARRPAAALPQSPARPPSHPLRRNIQVARDRQHQAKRIAGLPALLRHAVGPAVALPLVVARQLVLERSAGAAYPAIASNGASPGRPGANHMRGGPAAGRATRLLHTVP